MFKEPIHILGAGSVGMLWASVMRCSFPNYPVQLLLRAGDPRRNRTICLLQNGRPRVVSVPCGSPSSDRRTIRNLIVTTKAYDAVAAVDSVKDRLDPDRSRLIVLCNGALAVADALRQTHHGKCAVYTATTTHGVHRDMGNAADNEKEDVESMYTIVNEGSGHCYLEFKPMIELWNAVGLDCRTTDDINMLLWKKLAANCVINPLTAIHKCKNGELPTVLPSFQQTELPGILSEVEQVCHAETGKLPGDLLEFTSQVLKDTAENKSSMLVDVEHKKRTEIEYLNGYIAQLAKTHGIECRINRQLLQAISDLSSNASC